MAVSVKVDSDIVPVGSTAQRTVSGLSFQPKALVVFGVDGPTLDANKTQSDWMFGAATSATDCVATCIVTADASSNRGASFTPGKLYVVSTTTAATTISASFDGFTSDGFQFTPGTNTTGTTSRFGYMAIGGSDVTNAKCSYFASGTATGNVDTTGLGFDPDLLLIFASRQGTTTGATNNVNMLRLVGAYDGTTQVCVSNELGANGLGATRYSATKIFRTDFGGGASTPEATVSFITDGFRFNWTTAPSTSMNIAYLALKGTYSKKVGAITAKTSTGTQAYTGVGHAPALLALFGPALTAESATDARIQFGASDGTTSRGLATSGVDVGATRDADSRWQTAAYGALLAGTPTLEQVGSVTALGADGFTIDYTTNTTSAASNIYYLSIGAPADPFVTSAATAPFEPGETVTLTGTTMDKSGAGARIRKVGAAAAYETLTYTPTNSTTASAVIPSDLSRAPFTTSSHTLEFISTINGSVINSPTAAYTFNPVSGYSVVELTSVPYTMPSSLTYFVSGVTPVVTDQIHWDNSVTVNGVTVTVTVNSDGTVTLDSGTDPMPSVVSFSWQYWSSTDNAWSAWGTATFGTSTGITGSVVSPIVSNIVKSIVNTGY